MKERGSIRGLQGFFVAFAGQIASTVGSAITSFGVSIWLFQQTQQATSLTWASAAYLAPLLLLGPFAGTFVDRHNRKRIMLVADTLAGLSTLVMLLLLRADLLEAWHIYLLNALNGAVGAFQWPAFEASVTMMVDKEQYGRTSGFMQLGNPVSRVVAPAAAAALLAVFGFEALLWVDIATFAFAVVTLWLVVVPQPDEISAEADTSFLNATSKGFRYIKDHPSLVGLMLVTIGSNFGNIFGVAVLVPMILATTGNDEAALGTARAIAATGGIIGSLLLGYWGGPKERARFMLIAMIISSIFSVLYGISAGVISWAITGFFAQICTVFVNSSNRVILQRKVPPHLQGRVFSVQLFFMILIVPIVTAIAGPLADNYFEPAMQGTGWLATTFGWLVGNSPGSGMSLMFVIGGSVGAIISAIGYLSTHVRQIETLIPDYEPTANATTD